MDPVAPCAVTSSALGERLAGSATFATGWVAVEHDGPWGPQAPTTEELGPALAALTAVDGVRLQLVRGVRVGSDEEGAAGRHARGTADVPRTVLLAHAARDPAARWLRRLEVPDDAALAAVDPGVTLRHDPPAVGEPVEGDTWLVCTHARRDACCARWGRSAAAALAAAGHATWETTHTGGHRFAGTAVALPAGVAVGRLDATTAPDVAASLAAGQVDPAVLRGLAALPPAAQAADVALREHLGVRDLDAVLVRHVAAQGATTQVRLEVDGTTWRVEVVSGPAATPRPVSDGAAPTTPVQHTITSITR